MTQDELDALAAQHGGIVGTNKLSAKNIPNPVHNDTNPNWDPTAPATIPDPNPALDYQFKDGSHITLRAKADDQGNPDTSQGFDVVKNITAAPGTSAAANVRTVRGANGQDQIEVKDPSDPSGLTWVAVGGTVSNPDEDQVKAIQRQILEGQRNERETNQANGKGYLTNDQVATIDRDAQANKTSAADVQLRKDQLAQTAQDAERTAGLRQQEINNTATNQQADIQLRTQTQQAQVAAQKAANDLAAKRLELDTAVQNNTMTLDNAKFEYQKQYDAADLAVKQATQLQTQLDAANREADAQRTNATTQRGQDINAADNAATRTTTAANDLLSATDRQGTLGQTILNDRANNARDTLNQTLSPIENNKNFGLGSTLPAGFGGQLLQGIGDWTAQMAGGQDVLKNAQDMVHNANPTLAGTPSGAAWSAVVSQMLQAQQSQNASAGTSFPAPTGTQLPGQPTPDQYQPGGAPPTTAPNVVANPNGVVNIHFHAPTGSAPDPNAQPAPLYQGGLV